MICSGKIEREFIPDPPGRPAVAETSYILQQGFTLPAVLCSVKRTLIGLAAVQFLGCAKEGEAPGPVADVRVGSVVVNEVVASGSEQQNEFGYETDWFEIYNPGSDLLLAEGEWFVTDDVAGDPRKYELPENS